jgi:hypothetical protein
MSLGRYQTFNVAPYKRCTIREFESRAPWRFCHSSKGIIDVIVIGRGEAVDCCDKQLYASGIN